MSSSGNKAGPSRSQMGGFSLIELMIALVAGLVVVGAVLAFTVASVRASSENIRSTRLSQDLRAGMNLVMRELRRSGYDAASVRRLAQGVPLSSFTEITISGDCVTFGYNRPGLTSIGATPVARELKGLRRNSSAGTLEMNATSAPVSCTGTAGWFPVTDPAIVNITTFSVTPQTVPFCRVVSSVSTTAGAPPVTTTTTVIATGAVRNYALALTGQMRTDSTVTRTINDDVRVRADAINFSTTITESPAVPPTCP